MSLEGIGNNYVPYVLRGGYLDTQEKFLHHIETVIRQPKDASSSVVEDPDLKILGQIASNEVPVVEENELNNQNFNRLLDLQSHARAALRDIAIAATSSNISFAERAIDTLAQPITPREDKDRIEEDPYGGHREIIQWLINIMNTCEDTPIENHARNKLNTYIATHPKEAAVEGTAAFLARYGVEDLRNRHRAREEGSRKTR